MVQNTKKKPARSHKSEKALDRASREKLMELIDQCGLSIDKVDPSDRHGLLRGLKERPARVKTAGESFTQGLLQGSKQDTDYGEDEGYVPFQITIEVLGHKILSYTDTPEPGRKTSRQSIKKTMPKGIKNTCRARQNQSQ
jgi:hypothetical protein